MSQTYVRTLLQTIAKEINRPPESVESYIQILENNWFDTEQSLKELNESSCQRLNIPERLSQILLKKIENLKSPQSEEAKNERKEEKITRKEQSENLESLLTKLKKSMNDTLTYIACLETLQKIIENIIRYPFDEKYRAIKLTNKMFLEKLKPFDTAIEILIKLNFTIDSAKLFVTEEKIDRLAFEKALKLITMELENLKSNNFDPYKTSILSSQGISTLDVMNKTMSSSVSNEIDQLEELRKARKTAIKPITNRRIKALKLNSNKNLEKNNFAMQMEEEIVENEDPVLKIAVFEAMKKIEESQKFSSKRKKELELELKRPFFIETSIRIKFPDETIFEAKFTPLETLATVWKILKENLDPFLPNGGFLFRTPPYEKISDNHLNKTLEELECVPTGIFYFGFDDKNLEKSSKIFLNEKLMSNIDII